MFFPTFFHLSLNLAIKSSWSEPQSAPGLVFADCIELLHFWLQRYNQSDFSIDHLVMSVCRVFSYVVGRGCLLGPVPSLGKSLLDFIFLYYAFQCQIWLLFQVSLGATDAIKGLNTAPGMWERILSPRCLWVQGCSINSGFASLPCTFWTFQPHSPMSQSLKFWIYINIGTIDIYTIDTDTDIDIDVDGVNTDINDTDRDVDRDRNDLERQLYTHTLLVLFLWEPWLI